MNEQMTTKKPDIKSAPEGPKIVRGYEKGPVPNDPELGKDTHDLAQEAILKEQEIARGQIAKYQKEISKHGETKIEETVNEAVPQNLNEKEIPASPKSEAEVRLFNNLGWDENFINKKKKEFETMSLGQLYNEIQILSIQEMFKFLTIKEKGSSLRNKLETMNKGVIEIKNNKETIKNFKDLMGEANGAGSSLAMDNLNPFLKSSGYKGKFLEIFGKKEPTESFQEDIITTLLSEEDLTNFKKLEKIIKKIEERGSATSSLVRGASGRKEGYDHYGLGVKIEDIVKEIK